MGNVYTWEDLGTPEESAPTPAAPAQAPVPESSGPKVYTWESLGTPPEDYVPPTVAEDVPPAVASGIGRGAMGIAGLPGSIAYYTRAGAGLLSDVLTGSEQKKLDVQRAEEANLTREQRQAIAEGRRVPIGGGYTIPTISGMEEYGKENLPYYTYAPSTKTGEVFQTGATFGTEALVGGPRGAIRRVATGVGAGAGAETAGDVGEYLGGEWGKVVGGVAGAVAADLLGNKVFDFGRNILATGNTANAELLNAISKDFATNPAMRDKLRTAVENGENIYVADYLSGTNAQKLLNEKYSQKQQAYLNQINNLINDRKSKVQDVVDQRFAGLFQRDLGDNTYAAALKDANKLERDKLYTDLKALPQSQSVISPNLLALYRDNGYISDAIDAVNKDFMGKYLPQDVMPPMGGMAPNIQYWNEVKFKLDDIIKDAKNATTNEKKGNLAGAQRAKELLVQELDTLVPEYKNVRNEAAEMFEVENSLEAGYKLAQKTASGSPFDVGEFMVKFDKLGPEQKEAFAEGAGRYIMQKANGDMSGLISYMEKPDVQRNVRAVLGDERFDALYAQAVSSNLVAKANALNVVESSSASKIGRLAGEVGSGAALTGGLSLLATMNPASIATLGLTAVGAIGGVALNTSERKVANRVIELAFSPKPEDAQKFAKLLASDYDAVSVVRKLGDTMNSAAQKAIIAAVESQREYPAQDYEYAPPMKSGGRIARKSGGRVKNNPIGAEVKRVRALLSQKTANMLSLPDDAIATALHIAKRT